MPHVRAIRRVLPTPTSGSQILLTGTALLLVVGLLIGVLSATVFQHYVKDQLSSRLNGVMINRNDAFDSIIEDAVDKAILVNSSGGILRNLAALHAEPNDVPSLMKLHHDADTLIRNGYKSVRFYAADEALLVADGAMTTSAIQSIDLIASIAAELVWKNGFVLKTREDVYNAAQQHIGAIELERELPNLTRIYFRKRPIGSSYDSFTCGKDKQGLVVCFPSLLTQKLIRLQPLANRNRLPIDDGLEGKTGLRSAIDYRGRPVIAAYGPVGTFGLATIAKVDEEDLYAPAKDLIENVLFAVVGLLLVGTVMLNARVRPLVNRLTDAELQAKTATVMAIEREAKTQAVIENANDGILTMGGDGMIRSINRTGAGIFGHTPESLVGQHFTALLPERHRSLGHATFEEYKGLAVDSPAKRQTNLMTGLHASGNELHFELGTNQIKSHGEDLFIGILHDVTESKRVQLALKDSEERLRTITDNLPILIGYVNQNAEYEFVNVTYEKWFGRPRHEIVGHPVSNLFSASNYERVAPHIRQALEGELVHYEAKSLTPEGPTHGDITYLPDIDSHGVVKGYYILGIDTTAQKLAEEALEKQRELLQTVLETIDVGIVACDADGTLSLFNRTTKEFHGLPHQSLRSEDWSEHYSLYSADGVTPMAMDEIPLSKALRGDRVHKTEMAIRSRTGRMRRISATGSQMRSSKGDLMGAVVAMTDVTEVKEKEEQLRNLARYDTLTGLPNRNLFNERIRDAILRCGRSGHYMALMFLDVDRFKSVNDTHGHQAGDLVLKAFAGRLLGAVRKTDMVARLAGDEFVVILEGLQGTVEATVVADKILRSMKSVIDVGSAKLSLSTSIGIALNNAGECDADLLLHSADEALYAAKASGRGCYRFSAALVD